MKSVVLFGNSPSTVMAYYQLAADPGYTVSGFTVDQEYMTDTTMFELPMVPFHRITTIFPPDNHIMLISIAYTEMNTLRAEKYYQAKKMGYSLITYIHPRAIIYPDVSIGENCMIGPNTVIQPAARIKDNVVIRENCHIGHDSHIQEHCFIAGNSNISGNVTIEPYCFLGAGSIIKNGITIKRSSLIGAGVTMLESSNENDVYMNQSARKLPFPSNRMKI